MSTKGVPTLITLCIQTIAEHIQFISSLRNLPWALKQQIFEVLVIKNRVTKATVKLFLEKDKRAALHSGMALSTSLASLTNSSASLALSMTSLASMVDGGSTKVSPIEMLDFFGKKVEDSHLVPFITEFAGYFPRLHTLIFSMCDGITNKTLALLAQNRRELNSLQHIYLTGCWMITDEGIARLAQAFQAQLRTLALGRCYQLTNQSMVEIGTHCGSLQSLEIDYCGYLDDFGIQHLVVGCTNLRSLSMECVNSVLDTTFVELALRCTELQRLNVKGCTTTVQDSFIQQAAFSCPNLTAVNLCDCPFVSDYAVEMLAQRCPFLAELDLTNCELITEFSIKQVLAYCKALHTLVLRRCMSINYDSFSELPKDGGVQLRVLNLDSSPFRDDHITSWLIEFAPNLEELDLSFCRQVTLAGVVVLVTKLTKLRVLGQWSSSIPEAQLRVLEKRHPRLTIKRAANPVTPEAMTAAEAVVDGLGKAKPNPTATPPANTQTATVPTPIQIVPAKQEPK